MKIRIPLINGSKRLFDCLLILLKFLVNKVIDRVTSRASEKKHDEDNEVEQAPQVEDITYNSKIDLGDTSIPPFLRKLKK